MNTFNIKRDIRVGRNFDGIGSMTASSPKFSKTSAKAWYVQHI